MVKETPASPLIPLAFLVCLFGILTWKLLKDLRNRRIEMGAGVVLSGWDNPLLFWIMVALQCGALGGVIAIGYVVYFHFPAELS